MPALLNQTLRGGGSPEANAAIRGKTFELGRAEMLANLQTHDGSTPADREKSRVTFDKVHNLSKVFTTTRQGRSAHRGSNHARIRLGYPRQTFRLIEYPLQLQRSDVEQSTFETSAAPKRELLVLKPVGCDLATLAEKDEAVRAIPILDEVETLVYNGATLTTYNAGGT